jgi:hypothetical protein
MEELRFPTFDYYLDQSDPDVGILRRQEGSFVAAFSARGAPPRTASSKLLLGRIVARLPGLTPTRLVSRPPWLRP